MTDPRDGEATVREEFALRKPDGEIIASFGAEWFNGDAARETMQSMAAQYRAQGLVVVHRTVTFTEWEAVPDGE